MNLRHLEFFAAVVRRGTFSGASTESGVTQSALSQAISSLEDAVGSPLFDRSPTGVQLTSAGREFAPHALEALEALKRARDAATRAGQLEGGYLAIACPAALGIDPMPRLVAAFRKEFPEVLIRVHDVPEQHLGREQLFDIGADVVVTFKDLVADDLHTAELAPVELLAVLPAPAASPLPLRDLLAHGVVTTPADTAPHRFVSSRLGRELLEEFTAVEVVHAEGVLPLVLAGAGGTILPAGHARIASAMPGLTTCVLDPPALLEVVVAIPRATRSVAAHQFVRVCRENGGAA